MRVLGCRISDEDKSLVVDWYEENEQGPQGGTTYSTIITADAIEEWGHVGYYREEVVSDLEELVGWWIKYSTGKFEDS